MILQMLNFNNLYFMINVMLIIDKPTNDGAYHSVVLQHIET
jgi:hypothetical protein